MRRIYLKRRDNIIQRYRVRDVRRYVAVGRYRGRILYVPRGEVSRLVKAYKRVVEELPANAELHYIIKSLAKRRRMYRYSFGLKWSEREDRLSHPIVLRKKYFGALIQAWHIDRKELEKRENMFKDILIRIIERFVGYSYGDWWFVLDAGEGYSVVDFDEKLYKTWIARIEDSRGVTVYEEKGEF